MSRTLRLFMIIGQAAILLTGAYLVLTLASILVLLPPRAMSLPPPRVPSVGEAIALILDLVAPPALGFWWMFRRLRAEYPRRQALDAAVGFALFAPVALIIGTVLGPLVGGYASVFLGTKSSLVALCSAVAGMVVVVALTTSAVTLLALWLTRHTPGREP
jgi:hypothetical protein